MLIILTTFLILSKNQELPYSGTEADLNSNQMEALDAMVLLRIARRYGFQYVIIITDSKNSVRFVVYNVASYNPARALSGPTSFYTELVVEIFLK